MMKQTGVSKFFSLDPAIIESNDAVLKYVLLSAVNRELFQYSLCHAMQLEEHFGTITVHKGYKFKVKFRSLNFLGRFTTVHTETVQCVEL